MAPNVTTQLNGSKQHVEDFWERNRTSCNRISTRYPSCHPSHGGYKHMHFANHAVVNNDVYNMPSFPSGKLKCPPTDALPGRHENIHLLMQPLVDMKISTYLFVVKVQVKDPLHTLKCLGHTVLACSRRPLSVWCGQYHAGRIHLPRAFSLVFNVEIPPCYHPFPSGHCRDSSMLSSIS